MKYLIVLTVGFILGVMIGRFQSDRIQVLETMIIDRASSYIEARK